MRLTKYSSLLLLLLSFDGCEDDTKLIGNSTRRLTEDGRLCMCEMDDR